MTIQGLGRLDIQQGNDVAIECDVTSSENVNVYWYKIGVVGVISKTNVTDQFVYEINTLGAHKLLILNVQVRYKIIYT